MKRGWLHRFASLTLMVGVLLACLATTPAPVQAASKSPGGLRVSPVQSYPNLNPGNSYNSSLTLTNTTGGPLQITMSAETFQTVGLNYNYSFGAAAAVWWVQFDQTQIALDAGKSQVVHYTIAVPPDAAPGGRYLALMSSVSTGGSGQSLTEIHRVASLVYLQVNGAVTKIGQLLGFDLPIFTTKRSIPTNVRVANSGNSHFQARVGIYTNYWPWPGKGDYLSQVQGYILPGTVRQLSTSLTTFSTPGIYRFTAEFQPPSGKVQDISHVVFYIPYWFMAVLGVFALCLIILCIRLWRSHRIRHYKKDK